MTDIRSDHFRLLTFSFSTRSPATTAPCHHRHHHRVYRLDEPTAVIAPLGITPRIGALLDAAVRQIILILRVGPARRATAGRVAPAVHPFPRSEIAGDPGSARVVSHYPVSDEHACGNKREARTVPRCSPVCYITRRRCRGNARSRAPSSSPSSTSLVASNCHPIRDSASAARCFVRGSDMTIITYRRRRRVTRGNPCARYTDRDPVYHVIALAAVRWRHG